jgi:hypothetical protein
MNFAYAIDFSETPSSEQTCAFNARIISGDELRTDAFDDTHMPVVSLGAEYGNSNRCSYGEIRGRRL